MTRRSYGQHCALARALDIVGERWTLLLVRELLGGPKRYRDLRANLHAMGTNLLASRLRDLQDAGLVEHTDPHYALTDRGRQLEAAVLALAEFGAPLLGEKNPDDHWSAAWNPVALKYAFRPERAAATRVVIEFRVDDHLTQARIDAGTIETSGAPEWSPDASLQSSGETFLAIASGERRLKDAEGAGEVVITGSRRALRAGLRAFGLA